MVTVSRGWSTFCCFTRVCDICITLCIPGWITSHLWFHQPVSSHSANFHILVAMYRVFLQPLKTLERVGGTVRYTHTTWKAICFPLKTVFALTRVWEAVLSVCLAASRAALTTIGCPSGLTDNWLHPSSRNETEANKFS